MKENFNQAYFKHFFDINKCFPDKVFNNQDNLYLYCFQFSILEGNGILDQIIDKLTNLEKENRAVYLYFNDLKLENDYCNYLEINIQKKFEFHTALTKEDYYNFSLFAEAYFVSDTLNWSCLCNRFMEWVIFGVTKEFDSIFQEYIIKCSDFNIFLYSDINSAIRYSCPVGTSDMKFKQFLEKNYKFLSLSTSLYKTD